ncbi:DUF6580 family putative transport protein [Yunchengibacter salinarum]|uniref:DUF6580 family putative transport protein n=1 Tax=Yunchengibacter salinarum TaxID=3133399 RepID=UPI0035B60076
MQTFLTLFAFVGRLIPHPWNISPVGASGLFAGAHLPLWRAWLVPVLPMLMADLLLGFYDWQSMAFVYAGFAASVLVGRLMLARAQKPGRVAAAVAVNAALFFLLSNLGPVLAGFYPLTGEGILAAYVAGLPFLAASLIGDGAYAVVLFGGYALARDRGWLLARAVQRRGV